MTGRVTARFIGLLSTFVVARILSPDDYGIVAAAMILQDLAVRLQKIGFAQNVISSKVTSEHFLAAVFLGKLLLCFILSLSVFLLSDTVARWLNSPDSAQVLKLVCWMLFIEAGCNINLLINNKNGNFVPEILTSICSKFVAVVVTIALAVLLKNYYALAIGMLTASVSRLFFSYMFANVYFPFRTDVRKILEIYNYSLWYLVSGMGEFLVAKIAHFATARYFDITMLGQYSMASNISYMYGSEVCASIDKSNLSSLSAKFRDPATKSIKQAIQQSTRQVFKFKEILILPVYACFIVYSYEIIAVLLGEKWVSISTMFSLVSYSMLLFSFTYTYTTIINSLRQPKFLVHCMVIRLLGFSASAWVAVETHSIENLILGNLATQAAVYLFLNVLFRRRFGVELTRENIRSGTVFATYLSAAYLSSYCLENQYYGLIAYSICVCLFFLTQTFFAKDATYIEVYLLAKRAVSRPIERLAKHSRK